MQVRIQSSSDNRIWIFMHRDREQSRSTSALWTSDAIRRIRNTPNAIRFYLNWGCFT
jgi:hypothetical protein